MVNVSPPVRMLRALLAVAVACSWLLLTGLPAGAAITGASVLSPAAGAVLRAAHPVEVAVDTTPPEKKRGSVRTQLYYGIVSAPEEQQYQGEPVSDKVVELQFIDRTPTESGERLRFGHVIDPHNLAWLDGATGRNGRYTLTYTAVGETNEYQGAVEFRLDAPPPPQSAPTATVVGKPKAKRIDVAWSANAAPDLTGYTVERSRGDGAWRSVGDMVKPGTTQITDTVEKYGSYRYRVTAVRPAGDGSEELRVATSEASAPVALEPPPKPPPPPPPPPDPAADDAGEEPTESTTDDDSIDTSTSHRSSGGYPSLSSGPVSSGLRTPSDDAPRAPVVTMSRGYDDTYKGPLKYNVQQEEVTERVPIDIAQGGVTEEGGTLTVLDRAVDRERVLPPVAGGLILVLSAAHVLRYLND